VKPRGPTSGQNQTDTAAREPWTSGDLLDGDDHHSDMVPADILKKLGESEGLRDLLRNPHLRQVLAAVDIAGNKMDIMKTAMQEPLFMEFADQCLKIVEPTDSEDV